MINPPPNPNVIKDGIVSAFKFMSKRNNVTSVFNLNSNGFWDSCWTVFLINAVVSALASYGCLLYTSPSPRDATLSRMPSSA